MVNLPYTYTFGQIRLPNIPIRRGKRDSGDVAEEVMAGVAPVKFAMTTNTQTYHEHVDRFNDHHIYMYNIISTPVDQVKEHTTMEFITTSGGG